MKLKVETSSKAFAGGGFLAFREANRLLGGGITRLIDEACPNEGVPTSKKIELLVGQTIHGHKSTKTAWDNAKESTALAFVDAKLAKQKPRGVYRAQQAIGTTGAEALYEKIAQKAYEKLGIKIAVACNAFPVAHNDYTSHYVTGKKTDRAKHGHSSDRRPDKPQINVGVSQSKNVPFPKTYVVTDGNVPNSPLFRMLVPKHEPGTLIVADRGPVSEDNKKIVKGLGQHYLFGETLHEPDKRDALAALPKMQEVCDGYMTYTENVGGEYRHYFLSKKLQRDVREKRLRDAQKTVTEYAANLRKKRRQKKAKRKVVVTAEGEHEIVMREIILKRLSRKPPEQVLAELSKDNALDGVFMLSSDVVSDAAEALKEYKAKDELEKIFCALKSTLHARPFNARKKECVDGTIFVTMLSLLVVGVLALAAGVKGLAVKTLVGALQRVTLVVKTGLRKGAEWVECLNLEGLAAKLLAGVASTAT